MDSAGLLDSGVGLRFGGDVDAGFVEGKVERGGQVAGRRQVRVGFFAAKAVMQVGGMKDEAEFGTAIGEGAQQGYGVRAAGEADGEAQTWLEKRSVDAQGWWTRLRSIPAHPKMIRGGVSIIVCGMWSI